MTDEDAFLAAIRANPADDLTRLVYADWLDERADPDAPARAAFLRAECEVRRLPDDDPDRDRLVGRLRELAQRLAGSWKAAVARMPLENCGLRWGFECPKSWEQLRETDDHWVRFCPACRREVYYCTSVSEAKWRVNAGNCVAVDLRVLRRPGDLEPSGRELIMGAFALPEPDDRQSGEDLDQE
jgi:uncharacterized protein (TIGR02996 family)